MARRWGGLAGALAVVAAALAALPVGTPAAAAQRGGWVVERARFEPLDPATTGFSLDGGPGHRGAVEVGRGLAVVVDLPVEDYVRGIQEVPASWPAAAQQAQAVAARTFALHMAGLAMARRTWGPTDAHLCATESCQVYRGLASEQRPGGAAWTGAVAATAGQVLLHRGAPILAKYSSSNGGRSVDGGRPYLRAVDDPDDAASPLHRWTARFAAGDVAAAFGLPGPVVDARRERGTVVLVSERPAADPAGAPERTEHRMTVPAFRAAANARLPRGALPRSLPSDQFELRVDAGSVVAEGRGFGHGIGLGQWGAFGKARRGMGAAAILASYYAGLRPSPAPATAPARLRVALPQPAAGPVVPVALDPSRPPGPFRVVGDGAVLATVAFGAWQVAPGPRAGTVRVVPPPGQDGPVGLGDVAAERLPGPSGSDGGPVAVSFSLGAPAVVAVTGAAPAARAAGRHRVEVPAGPGPSRLQVTADAGAGRTAAVAVDVPAVDAPAPPPSTTLPDPPLAEAAAPPAAGSAPTPAAVLGTRADGARRGGLAPLGTGLAAVSAVAGSLAAVATARTWRRRRR